MELYKGYPLSAKETLEEMVEHGYLELVEPVEDDVYVLKEPGIYSCHIYGKDIYHTLRIFSVKEDELRLTLGEKFKPISMQLTEDGRQDGYQPTGRPALAPKKFRRDQRDMMLCIWPDEVLTHFGEAQEPDCHQALDQEALMTFLKEKETECCFMQLYSLGKTKNLDFDLPMAVLCEEVMGHLTLEECAAKLRRNGKPTVWYQAQVHGNEPASCDGAMNLLTHMIEKPEYRALLKHLNLIVIPRANPEAAYLYRRMNYDKVDLNRDHMAAKAMETRMLHQAFQLFQPEVILDGHEFIAYEVVPGEDGDTAKRGCQLMTSPATSLNIDEEVRRLSLKLCGEVFERSREAGLKINHFGAVAKNSIGRAYFGLHQCLSFLIETRGIGAGRYNYKQRVFAQVTAMTAYLQSVAAHAAEIKSTVEHGRKRVLERNQLILHQEASGEELTEYWGIDYRIAMDGQIKKAEKDYMPLIDKVVRSRRKPDAYLLPADMARIEEVLALTENLGITWIKADPGIAFTAEQYYIIGKRPDGEKDDDVLADLRAKQSVVFPQGAYIFTTKQTNNLVLAMLMEPDVTDSAGTKGTLFQQGLLHADEETGDIPLYRIG